MGWGKLSFTPTKRGGGKGLAMLKGGGGAQKSVEVVLTHVLDILAIVMGGWAQTVSTLSKGGLQIFK